MAESPPQLTSMLSRRQFLQLAGLGLGAIIVYSCGSSPTLRILATPTIRKPELLTYLDTLEKEGLVRAGYFSVGQQPSVHNIVIPKTGEVTQDEVDMALMVSLAEFIEQRRDLSYSGHTLTMNRPEQHDIIFVDRNNGLPRILEDHGEVTFNINTQNTRLVTLINLSGPRKEIGGQTFSSAWSAAQAVCLGYYFQTSASDAVCNVLSANVAAGWTNTDPTGQWISSLGETGEMAGVSVPYNFSQEVWDHFRQAAISAGKP